MVVDLTTTNILLGIMAVVSALEGLLLIGAGIMGLRMYRQVTEQIQAIEQRHLVPLTNHVTPLLDEAKKLTTQASPVIDEAKVVMQSVQRMAERVEHSLSRIDDSVQGTINTAEHAVDRVQVGARRTAGTVVGVVRGVRTAIETFLTDQPNGARGHYAAPAPDMPRRAPMTSPQVPPRSHVVYPDGPPYPGNNVPPSGRTS
jgi:uncharacterized protein YoxC